MAVEIKVPSIGESINEVVVSAWLKNEGDSVNRDESVVELESDKATVEVPAPVSGTVTKVLKRAGESAMVGEVIAYLEEGAGAAKPAQKSEATASANSNGSAPVEVKSSQEKAGAVMPAAQRVIAEKGLNAADVKGSGPGGRVLKEDALKADKVGGAGIPARDNEAARTDRHTVETTEHHALEEIVAMTPIRKKIAERLVESQQTAALLTT
ncbi:MAG: E3 binding domain-containing protein, partial [bacterium]|nr:E3 binding domain-containing protein [bacterium]